MGNVGKAASCRVALSEKAWYLLQDQSNVNKLQPVISPQNPSRKKIANVKGGQADKKGLALCSALFKTKTDFGL